MLNEIQKNLLEQIDDFHKQENVAYSLRVNGQTQETNSTDTIKISKKEQGQGLDIVIFASQKPQAMHMPVVLDADITEDVINDFVIGDNADITIVAGCGIHNTSANNASHNGIHSFVVGKNCRVKYLEKHLGLGNATSKKILSPTTKIQLGQNSVFEIETIQLGGVNLAERQTIATLDNDATLIIKEKVLTENFDIANSKVEVSLLGKNSKCNITSRSVAKNKSQQSFASCLVGENECVGRVECDAILLEKAIVSSTPAVVAKHCEANLSHEAQIGKIASEQLTKLMSLGLSQQEAENKIISAYLLH